MVSLERTSLLLLQSAEVQNMKAARWAPGTCTYKPYQMQQDFSRRTAEAAGTSPAHNKAQHQEPVARYWPGLADASHSHCQKWCPRSLRARATMRKTKQGKEAIYFST
jgi:hypothetical protein